MLGKIFDFSIRFPKIVIIIFLLITTFFAFQIPGIEIDTSLKNQLPNNIPSRLKMNKIEEIFGGTEIIIVSLKTDDILDQSTLRRTKKISDSLEDLTEIKELKSLFTMQDIKGKNNRLVFEDIINEIPQTFQEKEELRSRIKANDFVYGNIVSRDFKAVAIVGVLQENFSDQVLLTKINKIIKQVPGEEEVQVAGMPAIRAKITNNIRHDIKRFMPIGLLIGLIFLYLCFRQLRGVFLPFIVVVMSIIVSVGLISLFNWKIQPVTIILPVALMAITNDYGIHIMACYQEKNRSEDTIDKKELSRQVVKSLKYPIIASGLTTVIGLLCLLAHIIVPARQLGVLAAAGIVFAILASIIFMPAVLSLLSKPRQTKGNEGNKEVYLLEKLLFKVADFVMGRPKQIIVVFILIIIIISGGINKLKVDTNPVNYFNKEAKIVKSTTTINKYFGGANTISVVAKGDIESPVIMKKIDNLERRLKEYDYIEEVTTVSRVLRKINQELHNGDSNFNKVPDTESAIGQYLMLYTTFNDLSRLVDFNRKHTLVTARVTTNSSTKIAQIVGSIKESIGQKKDSPFIFVGGLGDLLAKLVSSVVQGQIISLFLSVVIVALIIMFLFRSFSAGLMSILPLILAIVSLFGLMGYLNIELNMITALSSSIMIGLGVDYTIHFLWRYREQKQDKDTKAAVKSTLTKAGRGIIFNALSVIIGFMVLLISNFLPVKFFGFLAIVSITGCLLGALVVLPALCIIFEPKFLED